MYSVMDLSSNFRELLDWQLEDLQKGPGVEVIGDESITRTMKIDGNDFVVTRHAGPVKELTWDQLIYIVLRGTLYEPAEDHYKSIYGPSILRVYCDRCKKEIHKSIGIDNKDLCMDCVDYVRQKM